MTDPILICPRCDDDLIRGAGGGHTCCCREDALEKRARRVENSGSVQWSISRRLCRWKSL